MNEQEQGAIGRYLNTHFFQSVAEFLVFKKD